MTIGSLEGQGLRHHQDQPARVLQVAVHRLSGPDPQETSGGPPELPVPPELAVEIGRTRMTIREALALGPGSIVTLNRLAGEPVDLLVNGKPIARGEVVVIR